MWQGVPPGVPQSGRGEATLRSAVLLGEACICPLVSSHPDVPTEEQYGSSEVSPTKRGTTSWPSRKMASPA